MKRLTILCISALLTLSATPDAFGWGAVSGPHGGAAYRGPMGGAAVRTPSGGAAVRTPSGAAAVRTPYGGAAARGPYGGTAVRGPVYGGGTVYRGTTVVTRALATVWQPEPRPVRQPGSRLVLRPVPRRPRPTHPRAITHLITATRQPTTSRLHGSRGVGGKTATIYLWRLSFYLWRLSFVPSDVRHSVSFH